MVNTSRLRKNSPEKSTGGTQTKRQKTGKSGKPTDDMENITKRCNDLETKVGNVDTRVKKVGTDLKELQGKFTGFLETQTRHTTTMGGIEARLTSMQENIDTALAGVVSESILENVRKMIHELIDPIKERLPPDNCTTIAVRGGSSTSPLTGDSQKDIIPKASRDALRNYLRFRWYGQVKFMTEQQAEEVLKVGRSEKRIDNNVTSYKHVLVELAALRQNSRSGAKATYIGKDCFVVFLSVLHE